VKWGQYILIAGVVAMVSVVGYIPTTAKDVPARTLPDATHCQMTASGWSCILVPEEEFRSIEGTDKFDAFNKHLKQSCKNQGGRWRCYGFCLPFYTRYCDFRFDDAGTLCTDSTQCNSHCVTDDHKCQDNCSGTCAEYALRSCDAFIEVGHGRTKPNFVVCD
jgi:hypothetical protein